MSSYTIKNLKTGESVRFGELVIHLIDKQHFFEDEGTQYRLDPKKLLEVIEMHPDSKKARQCNKEPTKTS